MATPACLFDLDGTCVDSDSLHFRAYQTVLLKAGLNNGIPITREFYDVEMSGKQNRVIMAQLGKHLPVEAQNAVWLEKEEVYGSYVDKGIKPIHGLVELFDRLERAGVNTAIVTNAPRSQAVYTLKALSLEERFGERVIIGEECVQPKPWPHPYEEGLKLLKGHVERTVAFEDSPSGIASARAAGLFTIGIMSSRSEDSLRQAGANFCIKNYEDEKLWPCLIEQLRLDK